jgi:dienelactone hydrolase
MIKKEYKYLQDGFEGILHNAENGDDRLIIVIQGLKGLELPEKYAKLFAEKGYSSLAMSYYGGEGQKKDMRAIPLEQFEVACNAMKKYGYKRIGIYGNSKGAGMALLAASVVPDISLVIAASSFGHVMQGTGKPQDDPCKAMVSYKGQDFPYVKTGKLFSDFLKRCIRERHVRLLYFFDEWDKKGTEENEIPVEKIQGDILLLTSTNDESVPAKRDAELLIKRLERNGFEHGFRHVNSEIGSHNLGYFPVNNNMLPREKKYPEECQRAREETLDIILNTFKLWKV